MNLIEEIRKLVSCLGPGKMSPSAYDTAWIARLGEIAPNLSYKALQWLCDNQLPDGSWGAPAPFYYHDRVISTLAAMIALTQQGRRSRDKVQVDKGLIALDRITSNATQGLMADPNGATIGFEMIVPTLISEAEKLGIIRQQGERILGRLWRLRKAKLEKMRGMKINRYVTMAFSAEMAGLDGQNMLDIDHLQEENGSVGHSPSATAYFVANLRPGDQKALDYLESVMGPDGSVPDLFPFEIYEHAWVLWNLALTDDWTIFSFPEFQERLKTLETSWHPSRGIGLSKGFSVPDGDNTSVTFELLSKLGRPVDEKGFFAFEDTDYFRCYGLEANPSISVNVHALAALRQIGYKFDHPTMQKILKFLEKNQMREGYWFDKWHISPYYTTSHAILAFGNVGHPMVKKAIDWIIRTQNSDGSWGFYLPTVEETAYCLQSLCICRKYGKKVPSRMIKMGREYIVNHRSDTFPLFWIGKGLYASNLIVQAEILSALMLSEGD